MRNNILQQGERADHNDCQRESYYLRAVPGRGLNNRKSDRTERRQSFEYIKTKQ